MRQQLLHALAQAADELGLAAACLGAAYEALDEANGDRLEEALFRPVQSAYGRARRTHTEFAARHGLPTASFSQPDPGLPSQGAAGFVERAVEAIAAADHALAELQDSMLPIEVGDPELRAGMTATRELIAPLPERARLFLRALGR
jgi:hypothetical protein